LLEIRSEDLGERYDAEEGIRALLARPPSDPALWASLTSMYKVDVFCGLFMEASNRSFGVSAEISKLLVDRSIDIVFDMYLAALKVDAAT
jgi:hypothetical protein